MNEQPPNQSPPSDERWEARLRETAHRFTYPPTPDIAQAVARRLAEPKSPWLFRRRLMWAAVIILVSLCALLAVPQVRAAVLNLLRLGGVIIYTEQPTATPTPTLAPTSPGSTAQPSATPRPSATPIRSILDLAGETTLAEAQKTAGFPIRLPTFPAGLGAPDRVYRQYLNGQVVVLVWLDSARPSGFRFALHILGPGALVYKMEPKTIQETTVNGRRALWTEGPYVLIWRRDNQPGWDMQRIVNGYVLVWTDDQLTYRLESDLSLAEAVKVAESVPPVKP